jgi:quinol monooxygenase YgiN
MQFIQTLEFRTSEFDKIRALDDEWRAATDGKRTLRRSIVCQDRNDKNRYIVLAFFDSPAAATANSDLPATANFAEQVNAIVDTPIEFHDLDVVDDRT